MGGRELNLTAIVSGALFVVLGSLFLLDRLGAVSLRPTFVWPILLIGLGLAVLVGGRRGREEPGEAPDEPSD